MNTSSKRWLITGVSSGLGRALASAALARGDAVVGTLREASACAGFEALAPGRAHARLLDVANLAACEPLVGEVERTVGAIDVLVNNAGYGHEGTIEESTLDDLRRQFDVNVFGPVAMIKAVLPHMRRRRSGRILNITSMGGFITMPGLGYYHGSKFALEGLSETLAKEVQAFGIAVTAVEPGAMRTQWAGRSMARAARSVADYDALFDPLRKRRRQMSGQQIGDPDRAATAMLALVDSEAPPVRLLLGSDALRLVEDKLQQWGHEIQRWRHLSTSTDHT